MQNPHRFDFYQIFMGIFNWKNSVRKLYLDTYNVNDRNWAKNLSDFTKYVVKEIKSQRHDVEYGVLDKCIEIQNGQE